MTYDNIRSARFLSRPNRFIAWVELDGEAVRCHVKNTGRCAELLLPGAPVWVQAFPDSPGRKTAWDLICVEKDGMLINIDSQAPNAAAREWLAGGGWGFVPASLRPEYRIGDSRFDFCMEAERTVVEVKGVTLERDGIVYFPDAPTQRGVRHLEGLTRLAGEGFRCGVLFVAQLEKVRAFAPNEQTHPAFADALRKAALAGVQIRCLRCRVTPDSMTITDDVPVRLC